MSCCFGGIAPRHQLTAEDCSSASADNLREGSDQPWSRTQSPQLRLSPSSAVKHGWVLRTLRGVHGAAFEGRSGAGLKEARFPVQVVFTTFVVPIRPRGGEEQEAGRKRRGVEDAVAAVSRRQRALPFCSLEPRRLGSRRRAPPCCSLPSPRAPVPRGGGAGRRRLG